jgi:hypothetical protein
MSRHYYYSRTTCSRKSNMIVILESYRMVFVHRIIKSYSSASSLSSTNERYTQELLYIKSAISFSRSSPVGTETAKRDKIYEYESTDRNESKAKRPAGQDSLEPSPVFRVNGQISVGLDTSRKSQHTFPILGYKKFPFEIPVWVGCTGLHFHKLPNLGCFRT